MLYVTSWGFLSPPFHGMVWKGSSFPSGQTFPQSSHESEFYTVSLWWDHDERTTKFNTKLSQVALSYHPSPPYFSSSLFSSLKEGIWLMTFMFALSHAVCLHRSHLFAFLHVHSQVQGLPGAQAPASSLLSLWISWRESSGLTYSQCLLTGIATVHDLQKQKAQL